MSPTMGDELVPRDSDLPESPSVAAFVGLNHAEASPSPVVPLSSGDTSSFAEGKPNDSIIDQQLKVYLELKDDHVYEGISFGAPKSAAGELVFQTGMVGYPESITDPSYRGQILVITFPLVGNYGVPSRQAVDEYMGNLPRYFESTEIHVAGLVVASYSGEQFSHHLATSSLGSWLKEQGVPAMYGVDTRALTKLIREEGSMLGRMLHEKKNKSAVHANGDVFVNGVTDFLSNWRDTVSDIEWMDQNEQNLVAGGRFEMSVHVLRFQADKFDSLRKESPQNFTLASTDFDASLREAYQSSRCGCRSQVQSTAMLAISRS